MSKDNKNNSVYQKSKYESYLRLSFLLLLFPLYKLIMGILDNDQAMIYIYSIAIVVSFIFLLVITLWYAKKQPKN